MRPRLTLVFVALLASAATGFRDRVPVIRTLRRRPAAAVVLLSPAQDAALEGPLAMLDAMKAEMTHRALANYYALVDTTLVQEQAPKDDRLAKQMEHLQQTSQVVARMLMSVQALQAILSQPSPLQMQTKTAALTRAGEICVPEVLDVIDINVKQAEAEGEAGAGAARIMGLVRMLVLEAELKKHGLAKEDGEERGGEVEAPPPPQKQDAYVIEQLKAALPTKEQLDAIRMENEQLVEEIEAALPEIQLPSSLKNMSK